MGSQPPAERHPLLRIMKQADLERLQVSRTSRHFSLDCQFVEQPDETWVCQWSFTDYEHPVQHGESHPQPTRDRFRVALDAWVDMVVRVLPGTTVVERKP